MPPEDPNPPRCRHRFSAPSKENALTLPVLYTAYHSLECRVLQRTVFFFQALLLLSFLFLSQLWLLNWSWGASLNPSLQASFNICTVHVQACDVSWFKKKEIYEWIWNEFIIRTDTNNIKKKSQFELYRFSAFFISGEENKGDTSFICSHTVICSCIQFPIIRSICHSK